MPTNSVQDFEIASTQASFKLTPNLENEKVIVQEREEKEKKAKWCLELSSFGLALFVGICSILVSVVVGLSGYYSSDQTNVALALIPPNFDRLTRINHTFYHQQHISKDRRETSIYIPNEILHLFSDNIVRMHNCKTSMEGFYGESGIGKTTMLKKALKILDPRPYLLITLSNATTEHSLGKKLNLQFNDNDPISWIIIEDAILKFLDNLPTSEKYCPIIIIDNANRNPFLTNQFVNMVSELLSFMSLMIVSSDGTFEEFGVSAGGRLSYMELFDPSYEFGVQYLTKLNITNQTEINKIIEIVGSKPLYLEYVERLIMPDGSVDLERLEKRVFSLVVMALAKLPTEVQKEINILSRALLERPFTPHYVNDSLPEEFKRMIFSSNIIRKANFSFDQRVAFQNNIVLTYFQKKFQDIHAIRKNPDVVKSEKSAPKTQKRFAKQKLDLKSRKNRIQEG